MGRPEISPGGRARRQRHQRGAAAARHIATVSRRLAALERRLGVRLFDRKASGYTLTAAGEAARAKAEEIEQAVLSVERQVLGRDLSPVGKVTVTTADDIAALVIAPRLDEFARRFPAYRSTSSRASTSPTSPAAKPTWRCARCGWCRAITSCGRPAGGNLARDAGKAYAQTRRLQPGQPTVECRRHHLDRRYAHLNGGPGSPAERGAPVGLATNSRLIQQAACRAGIGVGSCPVSRPIAIPSWSACCRPSGWYRSSCGWSRIAT